jgi:hypothetical protein
MGQERTEAEYQQMVINLLMGITDILKEMQQQQSGNSTKITVVGNRGTSSPKGFNSKDDFVL